MGGREGLERGVFAKKDNGLDSLYTVAAPRRLLEQVCHDLYRWIAKHIDPVSKCYGFLFEYQSGNHPIVRYPECNLLFLKTHFDVFSI